MSQKIDFQAFLEDQQDDGNFQGEGEFTIEHQKAARKMARFALPRPTAWVCKFVQAAVGWSVKSLTVNQGKVYTVFHFNWENPADLPTESDLVKGILNSGLNDDSPLGALSLGLRGLVELERLSFLVVLNDGEVKPKPVYAGNHFAQLSEGDRLDPSFAKLLGLTVTVAHFPALTDGSVSRPLAHYQASIVNELDKYCFLCPIPIVVDGRRIDDPVNTPQFQGTESFRPLLCGGPPVEPGIDLLPTPETFQERRLSVYTHPRRARRQYQGKAVVSAVVLMGMCVGPSNRGSLRVSWVKRGVVVDSTPVASVTSHSLTCEIFLNADGMQTDLTGFKVKLEEVESRLPQYMPQIHQFLSKIDLPEFAFANDRDQFSAEDENWDREEAKADRIKRVLKGGAAGLGLTVLVPLLGATVTLGTIVRTYVFRKTDVRAQLKGREVNLREQLKVDYRQMLKAFQRTTGQPTPDDARPFGTPSLVQGANGPLP